MHILIEILVFVVVIVVLILVHELGHFIVAKLSGMRVDEFGIGYPPRALTIAKIGETEYTLNWLPFGGFVRIYGEDGVELENVRKEEALDNGTVVHEGDPLIGEEHDEAAGLGIVEGDISPALGSTIPPNRSFSAKPRILQALTLVAGIFMNLLFAYLILTLTLVMGTKQALTQDQILSTPDAMIGITAVVPHSPADKAGFIAGDIVKSATTTTSTVGINYHGNNPAALASLISLDTAGSPMTFLVDRNGQDLTITATPKTSVAASAHPTLGFTLAAIGTIKTPLAQAPWEGAVYTYNVTVATAQGLWNLLKGAVTFSADLSDVSGPVGIAGIVGQATNQGLAAVLSLAGLISINLALVNLIPIPALDGGRLLFVIIEAITRKPINPKIAGRVNAIGFGLLLLLMVVITAHDIYKLFV